MIPRRIAALLATSLLLGVAPAYSLGASPRLAGLAARSVVAAREGPEGDTGFAYGKADTLIVGARVGSGVKLITGTGSSSSGRGVGASEGLTVVHLGGLGLATLMKSAAHRVSSGTVAFVLGPPLGYESERIRPARLPSLSPDATKPVKVRGALPHAFLGAPVLTRGGRLIGAVAKIGTHTWTLAPRGVLDRLVASTAQGGTSGPPILAVLVGALIVFAAGAAIGVTRSKRRRLRAIEATERRRRRAQGRAEPTLNEPLVQFRATEHADDEFEVIVKPRDEP